MTERRMKKCTMEPAEIVRLCEVEGWTLKRIGEAAGVSPAQVAVIRDQFVRKRKFERSSYARQDAANRGMRPIWSKPIRNYPRRKTKIRPPSVVGGSARPNTANHVRVPQVRQPSLRQPRPFVSRHDSRE